MTNYAKIKRYDIANGTGIRTSIFFSGCENKCKGCFNQELWDFDYGKPFTVETYEKEVRPTINKYIAGLSILGGDGLHPKNQRAVYGLCYRFKHDFPDKTIWLWSGYTWKEITSDGFLECSDLLDYVDVLVDGRFELDKKNLTLPFRGSENQRIIDVQKSLEEHAIVPLVLPTP